MDTKKMGRGPIILKGILDVEDAKEAVNIGAEGIIVSNHGGRQLDGASSSILALNEISKKVGSKTEVYFDGGVRNGADLIKAKALGLGLFLLEDLIYMGSVLGDILE